MNLEFNKLFAALLVAGIAATGSSFIARQIMHPHEMEEDAVKVESVASVAGPVDSAPKGPEPILALLATADIAKGEKLSKACAACHSFDQGGVHRVGPNLWGVVDHVKGSHEGFSYSNAMIERGGKWDYDALNHFLYKPKDYISGTKMNYLGLKKPEDRAAIIAWLRTLSASPVLLPSDAAIDAEKIVIIMPEEESQAE